jgi:hypothetical protein
MKAAVLNIKTRPRVLLALAKVDKCIQTGNFDGAVHALKAANGIARLSGDRTLADRLAKVWGGFDLWGDFDDMTVELWKRVYKEAIR